MSMTRLKRGRLGEGGGRRGGRNHFAVAHGTDWVLSISCRQPVCCKPVGGWGVGWLERQRGSAELNKKRKVRQDVNAGLVFHEQQCSTLGL